MNLKQISYIQLKFHINQEDTHTHTHTQMTQISKLLLLHAIGTAN